MIESSSTLTAPIAEPDFLDNIGDIMPPSSRTTSAEPIRESSEDPYPDESLAERLRRALEKSCLIRNKSVFLNMAQSSSWHPVPLPPELRPVNVVVPYVIQSSPVEESKAARSEYFQERLEDDSNLAEFCKDLGITDFVPKALELVDEVFPSACDVDLRMEEDPDSGDRWLAIDMNIEAEVDDFMDAYESYIEKWDKIASWPISDRVVLSYELV